MGYRRSADVIQCLMHVKRNQREPPTSKAASEFGQIHPKLLDNGPFKTCIRLYPSFRNLENVGGGPGAPRSNYEENTETGKVQDSPE